MTLSGLIKQYDKEITNMENNTNKQVVTENRHRPWGVALSDWENFSLPENVESMEDDEYENMIKWL